MGISLRRRQNSHRTMDRTSQISETIPGLPSRAGWSALGTLAACALAFCLAAPLCAQEHKSKVPIVGRLSSGNHEQAYSGKVQSLDLKQNILNVNSLQGRDSEIFPVKKNVRVESVNGNKMKLTSLTPGTTVLIYYDQKAGERTVKNIVVLSSGENQEKDKPAPSS